MNSILEEIYSTIVPSAPYIIAAYALVWAALLIYVVFLARNIKHAEQQIAVLEEALGASACASALDDAQEGAGAGARDAEEKA